MSVKVKPTGDQKFTPFDIELVEIDWKKRCELNDKMIEQKDVASFSFWGEVCLEYTTLTEVELNNFSTEEIVAISETIFKVANSKKK